MLVMASSGEQLDKVLALALINTPDHLTTYRKRHDSCRAMRVLIRHGPDHGLHHLRQQLRHHPLLLRHPQNTLALHGHA